MKKQLLRTVVLLLFLSPSVEAISGEAEKYVEGIRSVRDVKRLLISHLNPGCGTGSCVDSNNAEVCKLVAALDIRAGGVITTQGLPAQGSDLAVSGSDLLVLKRIWRQCKPTNDGFWRQGVLLRVSFQGDEKEVAEVSSALRATVNQSRKVAPLDTDPEPDDDKELSRCLLHEAERGDYRSGDGGRSALSILKACQPHVAKWVDSCTAGGEARDPCTKKTLLLAQLTLKLAGK